MSERKLRSRSRRGPPPFGDAFPACLLRNLAVRTAIGCAVSTLVALSHHPDIAAHVGRTTHSASRGAAHLLVRHRCWAGKCLLDVLPLRIRVPPEPLVHPRPAGELTDHDKARNPRPMTTGASTQQWSDQCDSLHGGHGSNPRHASPVVPGGAAPMCRVRRRLMLCLSASATGRDAISREDRPQRHAVFLGGLTSGGGRTGPAGRPMRSRPALRSETV